ncbi:hypothetical protein PAECIP111802_04671 [Paenibacillus allorhizosphaerae]|uniref:Transposase InsH N-terminal domain-containing protein n=1 Tax=Paenibacillus allorhizosphaerae TaxID=2849866 RepID=A0ABM8VMP7_9BACL|nr:hypothetical protein PAECIP111802_04671 [Paenibacillus allorhizosphaerae]
MSVVAAFSQTSIVDFGFIYDLVKASYCMYYGRPANEPELLFRLLFLQILFNLSDERVVQETQVTWPTNGSSV